jgi:hypothetical protein
MDLDRLSLDDLKALRNNNLDGMSLEGLNYLKTQQKASVPAREEPKEDTGATGAFKSSYESLKGELGALAGKTGLMDQAEAEKYYKEQKEKAAALAPTEKSWTEAPFQKLKETAAGSVPYMAAPLIAGGAAALGGAPALVGAGAAGLASGLQFTGSNLGRQMEEGKTLEEASLGKAAAAAIPQAALDVVGFKYIPGIQKIFASVGRELTEQEALAIIKQGTLRTAGQYIAGGAKISGIEGATEAGQQFFERLQAGLNLTDEQARKEYLDNFIGGAALGVVASPFGVHGTRADAQKVAQTAQERRDYAEQIYKEKLAQDEQAQQELQKRQAETGQITGEAAPVESTQAKGMLEGAVSPLPNVPSTLTATERMQQEEDAAKQKQEETAATLRQHQVLQQEVKDVEAQMMSAAEKGDVDTVAQLGPRLQQMQAAFKTSQEGIKKLSPVEESPDVKMAELRGKLKKKTAELQKFGGEGGDSEKVTKAAVEIKKLQEQIAEVQKSGTQFDLFEPAKMEAEDRAAKQQQAEQRQQEQQDLFAQLPQKEAAGPLDKYQEGLRELEEAHASNADQRIIDDIVEKIRNAQLEKGMKSAAPAEEAAVRADRIKRALAEEKQNLTMADTEEERAAAMSNIEQLEKRLALAVSATAKSNPEAEQANAKADQATAHDNLLDAVDDLKAGRYLAGKDPRTAASLRSGVEAKARDATANYIEAATRDVNAIRAANEQAELTTDEALKLAFDLKDTLDKVVANKNVGVLRVAPNQEVSYLEKQIDGIKNKYTQGPAKKVTGEKAFFTSQQRDAAQMLKTEKAKKTPDLQKIRLLEKEVEAGKREDERIAAEKEKAERKEPEGVNPDQYSLFGEKQLEPIATVRASHKNFMRFVDTQRVKLQHALEIAKRVIGKAAKVEKDWVSKHQPIISRLDTVNSALENYGMDKAPQLYVTVEEAQKAYDKALATLNAVAPGKKAANLISKTEAERAVVSAKKALDTAVSQKERLPAAKIKQFIDTAKAERNAYIKRFVALNNEKHKLMRQLGLDEHNISKPLTEQEIAKANRETVIGMEVTALEDELSTTRAIAESRSNALRKFFTAPIEEKMRENIAELQLNKKYHESMAEWYKTHKNKKERKFAKAYEDYAKKIQKDIESAEAELDKVRTWESDLLLDEKAKNNEYVKKTRQRLKELEAQGEVEPEFFQEKVDDVTRAEAKASADLEKRIGEARKKETESAERLKELPSTKLEQVVAARAKFGNIEDVIARKITTRATPKTEAERRAEAQEKQQEITEEQVGLKKAQKERAGTPLTQAKEIRDVVQRQAMRTAEVLGNKSGKRPTALKPSPAEAATAKANEKVTKQIEDARRTEKEYAGEAGVRFEDYLDISEGMKYGFKARMEPSNTRTGLSQASAQKVVDDTKIPKGVDVKVIAVLPEGLKKYIREQGYDPDTVKGFVTANGKIVVVAINHANTKEVEQTLAHEITGHMGVDGVLGKDGMYNLAAKIDKQEGGIMGLAKKLGVGDDAQGAYDAAKASGKSEEDARIAAVSEMIAHVAEMRPTKSNMQKAKEFIEALVGALRAGLRKMGIKLDINTNDVYKLLSDARKDFEITPGAYKTSTGNIQFRSQPKYNSKFADLGADVSKVVSKNQTTKDKIKAAASGMKVPSDILKPTGILSEKNRLAFRTRYIDRFAPVEKIANKLSEKFRDSLVGTQLMYYLRMHDQNLNWTAQIASGGPIDLVEKKRADGKKETILESQDGASLLKVSQALKKADVGDADAANQLFTFYLAAKRAQRVGLETLNFDKSVTQPMLDRVVNRINADTQTKAAFEEAAKIYNDYNKGLVDFAVKTGRLSKEDGAKLLEAKDYVPFYRVRPDGSVVMDIGGATSINVGNITDQPYLHELVGGDTAILDVFTSSLQNTRMLTDMSLRNLATRNVAFSLQQLGLLQKKKGKDGKEIGSGIYEDKGNSPANDSVIRFMLDGKKHYAVVDTDSIGIPADLLVKGMDGVQVSVPNLVKVAGIPARMLRSFITRNPAYAVRQIARDSLSNAFTTGADSIPVMDNLKQLGSMLRGVNEGELLLKKRGILGGQVIGGASDSMQKAMLQVIDGKPGWSKAMAYLDHVAMMGDASSRVTSYNSFVKQGLSDMEATLASLEAMNFSKRGTSPSFYLLNQMVPFLNAQIQGLDVLYKAFAGKMPFSDKLKIKEKLLKRGALMAGMTMAYTALMYDDDLYKNATPQERIGNWFVKLPGMEEAVRVPIPFEIGGIFKMLPEMVYSTAFKDKKLGDAASEIAAYSLNQFVPSVMPTIAKPFVELPANYSFFTGKPIEGARLQKLEPGMRANANTPEVLKAIGEATNISPVKMEYLIRTYTGSLPLAMLTLANPVTAAGEAPEGRGALSSTTPIVGAFFQPKDATGLIEKAYEQMADVQKAQATYRDLVENDREKEADAFLDKEADLIGMARFAGQFNKKMGELAKQEREVRSMTGISGAEKRQLLDEIRQTRIEMSKEFISARE